jgi:formylglycine-generating enzyme required for sulfatase activity
VILVCALLLGAAAGAAQAPAPAMRRIPAGEYEPFFPSRPGERVRVAAFRLDVTPVTNAQFLELVRGSPQWQRSHVARLFADERYLAHWAGDDALGAVRPDAPVVNVSWFAARAYCRSLGRRLPTEAEWELAARADERRRDGMTRPRAAARILRWYARPQREIGPVGAGRPNVYGIHDLHGLVWEWVSDFNAALVSSDGRQDRDREQVRFCGGAALEASDRNGYATFMRYAFRSSLSASYTVSNLGFRCAS